MGLSDEMLAQRPRLRALRSRVAAIVERERAIGGFLVDEEGAVFAAAGSVALTLPHPLAGLAEGGSDAVLQALVGEGTARSSRYLVVPVSDRALFTLVHAAALDPREERRARDRLREDARELRTVVEGRGP